MSANSADGQRERARGGMSEAIDRARLIAAYQTTRYIVRDGGRELVARIGERSEDLDRLLARHGADGGIFITAWNPRSRPRARAENEAASARMASALAACSRRWLPHEGRGETSDWSEHGFFVLDLPADEALALAARFGQNAVVEVRRGAAPRLLFTALMPG